MLKVRKQKQQTTSTHWCPRIDAPFPPFAISSFPSDFSFLFGSIFYLSELGTFLSISFEWPVDARCRSHGVHILMSFFPFSFSLFFLHVLLSFIFCQNWWSCSISDEVVDNCLTGIRRVYWRVKDEGLLGSAVWCSVYWARLSITAAVLNISVIRYRLY